MNTYFANKKEKSNKLLFICILFFLFFGNWISVVKYENFNYLEYYLILIIYLIGLLLSGWISFNLAEEKVVKKHNKNFFFRGYHKNLGCEKNSVSFRLGKFIFFFDDLLLVIFFGHYILLNFNPKLINNIAVIYCQLFFLCLLTVLFFRVFYSFFKKSKQLCVPRIMLFFLLVSQTVLIFNLLYESVAVNLLNYLLYYLLGLILLSFLFFRAKQGYIYFLRLKEDSSQFIHFKNSKESLEGILSQKIIEIPSTFHFDLHIGNPSASKVITLIVHALDESCLEYLNNARNFSLESNEYKFQIILFSNSFRARFVTKVILSTFLKNGNDAALDLLFRWYLENDPKLLIWIKKYYKEVNNPKNSMLFNSQINTWNMLVRKEIKNIPSVFFEGRLMPPYLKLKNFRSYFK